MGEGVPHSRVSPGTHTPTLPTVPRLDPRCPGATLPGKLARSHLDTSPKRLSEPGTDCSAGPPPTPTLRVQPGLSLPGSGPSTVTPFSKLWESPWEVISEPGTPTSSVQ